MCLAIPGKVVRWIDTDPLLAVAEVEFGGVTRPCHMACVCDALVGDYVVVHAGVAIARLDAEEALRALAELASLPDDGEWRDAAGMNGVTS
ncbi:MAG: HypC/HybG/HupF family hydrogenase formation chaperone [Pirellulales bacterium]